MNEKVKELESAIEVHQQKETTMKEYLESQEKFREQQKILSLKAEAMKNAHKLTSS